MEYITRKFENTHQGLAQKDITTRQLASEGYRIVSEQIEQGHIKGEEQCCGALICLPLIFAAGRTPGFIVVTYGREAASVLLAQALFCTSCGARVSQEMTVCSKCGVEIRGNTSPNEGAATLLAEKKQIAKEKTAEAQRTINELSNMLLVLSETVHSLHEATWGAPKQYGKPKPAAPSVKALPRKPDVAEFEYRPSFLIRLVPSVVKKRSDSAQQRFLLAKTAWGKEKEQIEAATARDSSEYQRALKKWEADKKTFDEAEAVSSESKRKLFFGKDPETLKEHWETVISRNKLPAGLTRSCGLTYLPDRRTLTVDCRLPSFDSLPRTQEVRYSAATKAFEDVLFSRSWQDDFYEQLIYKITLKTLFELFQSDSADALDVVIFSGFVRAIDRAVGHEVKAYIISAQAMKQEFLAINLAQVDPKACVRRMKGRVSERMSELEPIEPFPHTRRSGI